MGYALSRNARRMYNMWKGRKNRLWYPVRICRAWNVYGEKVRGVRIFTTFDLRHIMLKKRQNVRWLCPWIAVHGFTCRFFDWKMLYRQSFSAKYCERTRHILQKITPFFQINAVFAYWTLQNAVWRQISFIRQNCAKHRKFDDIWRFYEDLSVINTA